jgi:hypothetical protein
VLKTPSCMCRMAPNCCALRLVERNTAEECRLLSFVVCNGIASRPSISLGIRPVGGALASLDAIPYMSNTATAIERTATASAR